jgi:hypothetical protein
MSLSISTKIASFNTAFHVLEIFTVFFDQKLINT